MANTIEQNFLQSPEWEKFQQASGQETFRAGESLFIAQKLPIVGKYAYSPRGPVIKMEKGEGKSENKMREIVREAKKRNCGWIRIEPNSEEELKCISDFLIPYSLSLIPCRRDMQPRETLVMDISKSEEQLLSEMKPKTRYNVRLAEKKGVRIIVSKEEKYQQKFIELVRETSLRAGIRPHPEHHYRKMFESLGDAVALYSAEYEGEIIAANMMIFFGDGAIYLHGGSGNSHRNIMAPFFLQWRAMTDAKAKGCRWYDFGGISTKSKMENGKWRMEKKEWEGITNFKQGFCPQTESTQFPGTYDIILKPWRYRAYRLLHWIKTLRQKID